ncbi:peptidyl-prolyl cis-trans isomerase [Novosphingobium sp. ZN18A2]|uniref:peptidyl-prolyl cis-trans isomerase n=1 Tax=Novosphingobium sp. ZN18A2 TaxID=3079861 RepID=UPI0030CAEDB0
MLGLFRKFFSSRFGVAITLAFLVLIAIAFASADVTGSQFGGITGGGGETVATVGKSKIGANDVEQTAQAAFQNAQQQQATLTMQEFLGDEGLDQLVGSMIQRLAIWEWGKQHGMAVSNRLIGSELAQIPAFQGPDGKFNEQTYRQAIAQRRLTEQAVRDDLSKGLMARQVLTPASFGATMPNDVLMRYVALFKEKREGAIAILPSALFAPKDKPDDKTIKAYYDSHKADFTRPERRTIRYAIVSDADLKDVRKPTDAEIKKRYDDNSAVYAPTETRSLTQLIVPDEDTARKIAAEAGKGTSLDTAAKAQGLATSRLVEVSKDSLAGQTTQDIADAAFKANEGTVLPVTKGPLGWLVLRVDAIQKHPGKTLEQARPEIEKALTTDYLRKAMSDQAADADDKFSTGSSLTDVAKDLGVTVNTTQPLVSDGTVYGKANEKAPDDVQDLLKAAFAMDREGAPQVASVAKGEKFAIFDVGQITPSAPAPLAEIKQDVERAYMIDEGSKAAKKASDKVLAALGKGKSINDALKEAGVRLPPPDHISMTREQLAQTGNRVPPPLALMFSMAKGTSKRLEAPRKMGWFVVSLDKIIPGEVKPDDPLIKSGASDLNKVLGREYSDQLRQAITRDIGSKRNPKAMAAVRKQLLGGR